MPVIVKYLQKWGTIMGSFKKSALTKGGFIGSRIFYVSSKFL